MPLLSRKSVATASPADLLAQARQAQADHAQAVADANAALVQNHSDIYADVTDRQATLKEQVALLQAEHDGLDTVKAEVAPLVQQQ